VAQITQYYGIDGPVEFADIDVSVDNRKFLDPHAIRLAQSPQPFVAAANRATSSFFSHVSHCAMSGDAKLRAQGLEMLQHFEEPWETRLGLASEGFRGHGGARDVGSWIWNALTSDVEALLRIGLLQQIEDLPLFVGGVDRDITSDITTRIVFDQLAAFTADMLLKHPEIVNGKHQTRRFSRQVWDSDNLSWHKRTMELPLAEGKPLLLVPSGWVRPTLLMSAGRYYETSVLTWAQLEQAVTSRDGKLLTTPKDVLRKQTGLIRGRSTNLRLTLRADANGEDLLQTFRQFVDSRHVADTSRTAA